MTFTEDNLKRFKEWLNRLPTDRILLKVSGYEHEFCPSALLARLGAAEDILNDATQLPYGDGYLMYALNFSTKEIAKKMEAWRKAKGEAI